MVKLPPPPMYSVHANSFSALCPHCKSDLQVQPQFAGQQMICPICGGRFQAPIPHAATQFPSSYPVQHSYLNPGIKTCFLVSGIVNIIVGLFWISTICGAVIGIPQIVLAIFEFIYFAQADRKPLGDALGQANIIAILEIVSGLFNLVSLICGIIALVLSCSHTTHQA